MFYCLKDVSLFVADFICLLSSGKVSCLFCLIPRNFFFLRLQASHRILKKARLVRSPRSPKQLPAASKRSFPWQRKEQIALIQFVALFEELKKKGSEWPTFGNRHEYWYHFQSTNICAVVYECYEEA